MSFKREGNDGSLLNVLRKRRVQDLFAEDIPDDEATILSNGKFTCTVCHYKPVFDTVLVLAQHRSGKKHLEYVKRAKEKREELEELIILRQQEQYLYDGSTAVPGVSKTAAPLLNNAPYDARAQKNKIKTHDRKPSLNLSNSSTNPESYLGGAKIPFQLLKDPSEEEPQPFKPYVKRARMQDGGHTSLPSSEEKKKDSHHKNDSKSNFLPSKTKAEQLNQQRVEALKKKAEWNNFNASLAKKKCSKLKTVFDSSGNDKSSLTPFPEESSPNTINTQKTTDAQKAADPQKKDLAYKYWQLAGSGWKKDWSGNWVKDEEAEFDSDEEPPELP